MAAMTTSDRLNLTATHPIPITLSITQSPPRFKGVPVFITTKVLDFMLRLRWYLESGDRILYDRPSGHKKRVLVVDDEPGVLRFVKVALTAVGYDVTTTASGNEALKLVRLEEPDIMLLDLLMVPMTGFEVLEKLRIFSQVPVIVFTARSFVAEEALKSGANGFIAKPFQPQELASNSI